MFYTFIQYLPQRFLECYRGYRWLWHLAAVAFTVALVLFGFDWWFFEHTRAAFLQWFILAAGIGGFFVPVLAPLALYWRGEYTKNAALMRAGALVAQSEFIAIVISSLYKAFTGRFQPEFLTHYGATDISREFHFGFLQHGIFWGWPSSHAAVAFAGMVALSLVIQHRGIRSGALLYASLVAFGAAVGFHWFSDVAAGIILGTLIGASVVGFKPKAK